MGLFYSRDALIQLRSDSVWKRFGFSLKQSTGLSLNGDAFSAKSREATG